MSDEKDPRRVEAGKKAAETRKEREGDQVFSEMGKKGGEARSRGSTGSAQLGSTDEINRGNEEYTGRDAMSDRASNREEEDQGKDPVRVEAGKKAAETRKDREGEDIFHKLGEKGAEARWGHGSTDSNKGRQQNE